MKKLFTTLLVLVPILAHADLNTVIVQPAQIPSGWATPYSHYEVSTNAMVFFDNYESTYGSQLGEELVQKKFQSFGSANRGTVFYLEFKSKGAASKVEAFAKNFILEGNAPSPAHPEKIFTVENTLVIISFADSKMADTLEKLIKR